MRVVVDTNVLVRFVIHPNPEFDHLASHDETLVPETTASALFPVVNRENFFTRSQPNSAI
jgi:predicted nucleic acid-binding protein